jgi:hypothetical protein
MMHRIRRAMEQGSSGKLSGEIEADETFIVDHAVAYVNVRVHTNALENLWSPLKRGISGTYVSVEPFHLFRYLDEQAYRFTDRELTDAERFSMAVSGIVTLQQLTGKTEDTSVELWVSQQAKTREKKTNSTVGDPHDKDICSPIA